MSTSRTGLFHRVRDFFVRRRERQKRIDNLGIPSNVDPDLADLNGVLARELEYIRSHRHPGRDPALVRRNLVGLALSGGGIRSATTNLGVLQALARMRILPMVDYISTVSGGGYIGACLSSLLSWNERAPQGPEAASAAFTFKPHERPLFSTRWEDFPFRAERRNWAPLVVGADIVAHLRTHGNFLIARLGMFRRETLRSIGNLLTGTVYYLLLFVATLFAVSTVYLALVVAVAPATRGILSAPASRVAGNAAGDTVARTPLVDVDSTVSRTSSLACPEGGCQVRTTLRTPTLAQRVAWNGEAIGRMLERNWRAWQTGAPPAAGSWLPARLKVPLPFEPLVLALVAGAIVSALTFFWIGFALRRYLRGGAAKALNPKRGETQEDTFERRVLLQLGWAFGVILVGALGLRVWLLRNGTQLQGSDQLVWLFVPLAVALGAWMLGFVIGVIGESHFTWWTRRMRSLWGAFQAIGIYGIVITLSFALLPLAIYALGDNTEGLGLGAIASLAATRLLTSRASEANGKERGRLPKVPVGLRNFLLGVAVALVFLFGVLYFASLVAPRVDGRGAAIVAAIATALFAVFAWSVNANKVSPHYFYRDRLAETYLLSELPDNVNKLRLFRDAMEMPLSSLHGDAEGDGKSAPAWRNTAPYHLISAAINMAGSRDLTRKDRKSGYWLFSKLYCGSVHTGFRLTAKYREGETKVARAIAISGAAASSAMGYMTFFAQAFATVLFNVRLGHWLENPGYAGNAERREGRANWPKYLWREITTDTVETTRLVNLSDGGHTGDNVGIYPLLQRRCKIIIACDAEGDSSLTFGSFTEALRHAYVDMGIDVDIDLTMIRPDATTGLSRSHCAVGRIRYPDRPQQESFLIYIKNSITGDEPEPVLNYRSKNPVFPHETTADQFFDDAQFESYRALGVHIAEHTFARWVRSPSFTVARERHEPRPPVPA